MKINTKWIIQAYNMNINTKCIIQEYNMNINTKWIFQAYNRVWMPEKMSVHRYSIIFVINLTPISLSLISRDFYSGDGETIFYS